MKVFISWSGTLSQRVAELLKEWIPNVLQNAEPWISSADIEKGEIWFGALSEKLADISVGIICLTRENINAPWILFEAGSLSKGLTKNRVCTFLIESEPTDLKPPLSQFNATKPNKEDLAKLILTINASDKDKMLPEPRIQASFEQWWPKFEEKFHATVRSLPPPRRPKRAVEDMTVEILETVRAVQRQMQRSLELPGLLEEEKGRVVRTFGDSQRLRAVMQKLVARLHNYASDKGLGFGGCSWNSSGRDIIAIIYDHLGDQDRTEMTAIARDFGVNITFDLRELPSSEN